MQLPVLGKNSLYVLVLILRILLSCHFDNTKQAFFFHHHFRVSVFLNIFTRLRCVCTISKLTTTWPAADESIRQICVCKSEDEEGSTRGVSSKSSNDAKYSAGCELTSFGYIPRNWEYYFFFSFYQIVFIETFIFVFSFLRSKTQKFIFFNVHIRGYWYMSVEKSITSSSRIFAFHLLRLPYIRRWSLEDEVVGQGGEGVLKEQQKHVASRNSLLTNGTALRKKKEKGKSLFCR